jgi:hypothetical protein
MVWTEYAPYAALFVMAMFPVYIGAKRSVHQTFVCPKFFEDFLAHADDCHRTAP